MPAPGGGNTRKRQLRRKARPKPKPKMVPHGPGGQNLRPAPKGPAPKPRTPAAKRRGVRVVKREAARVNARRQRAARRYITQDPIKALARSERQAIEALSDLRSSDPERYDAKTRKAARERKQRGLTGALLAPLRAQSPVTTRRVKGARRRGLVTPGASIDAATLGTPSVAGAGARLGIGAGTAILRNPKGVATGTAKGLKDSLVGAPAAALKFAADTAEGLSRTVPDPTLGVRRAGADYAKDAGRRYGGLSKPGGVEKFSKRVEKEGLTGEIFDALVVAVPSLRAIDRGLSGAAKAGRLGEKRKATVTEPRRKKRTSGGEAVEQPVARGLVKAGRQKKRDERAVRTVERKLATGDTKAATRQQRDAQGRAKSRQDAVLREAAAQGDVVPTRLGGRQVSGRKLRKAQRVAYARRKGRALQAQRQESRQEVGLGANKVISGLSKEEQRGFKVALQAGATTRGAAVAHARTRLAEIERNRESGEVDVVDTDEVPALERMIEDPDAHFTPKVAAAVKSERDRGARVAADDPGLGRSRAERVQAALLRSLAPQFETLGVKRRGTPIAHAVRQADEGVKTAKKQRAKAGRQVETEQRRASREEGRARVLSGQADSRTRKQAVRVSRAVGIHERAAANHERRAKAARTPETRARHQAAAKAARQRETVARTDLKGLIGAMTPDTGERRRAGDRSASERHAEAGPLASSRALAEAVSAGALGKVPEGARRRATDAPAGDLGSKPRKALSRLERARGRQLEAEQARVRSRQGVREAGKASRARRAEQRRGVELVDAEPIAEYLARGRAVARSQTQPLEDAGFYPSRSRKRVLRSLFAGGGSRATMADRRYRGELYRTGREDSSPTTYLQGIQRNIKRKFNWNLVADTFDEHAFEWGKNKTISQLETELARRGIDPDSVAFWNPERFRRERVETEDGHGPGDNGEVGDATLHGGVDSSTLTADQLDALKGDAHEFARTNGRWSVVPKEVFDEIMADTKPSGVLGRGFDVVKGKQARVLLGLSPAWLQFQIVSNGLLTGLAGAGPIEIAKSVAWWRKLDPEQRKAIEPYVGIGHFQDSVHEVKLGASTDAGIVNAWRAMKDHPFWHKARKPLAGASVSQLNPLDALFRVDNAQNNFFRRAVFYNAVKRDAYKRMGESVGEMQTLQNRLVNYLNLGPEEKMKALVRDRADLERHAEHVRDFLGDYLTYTAKERRTLGRAVMFYGFLRFSLRFTFYTMPVKHPVKTAIIGQLGRMQAEEVRRLLGGDELPFAMGRFYFEKGGKLKSIDLARANPFLNTLTEVNLAKGVRGPLLSALRLAPPAIVGLIDAAFAKSSFRDRALRVDGESQPRPQRTGPNAGEEYTAAQLARFYTAGLLRLAAPYRANEKARAQGRPISDDSISLPLIGRERYTGYKDPQIRAGIQQASDRLPKGYLERLALEFAPFVPRHDFSPEIARKRRQAMGKASKGKPLSPAQAREQRILEREARAAGGGAGVSKRELELLLREAELASGG